MRNPGNFHDTGALKLDPTDQRVNILGFLVDNVRTSEIVGRICNIIGFRGRTPNLIGYVEINRMNFAFRDRDVAEFLNKCVFCYCDGNGVRWGAKLLGYHLAERMTAPDFIMDLFKACVKNNYSVYVLGGKPGVLEKAFDVILKEVPELKLAGLQHGYFNLDTENDMVVGNINKTNPDLLIVGMGVPLQEKWVLANRDHLKAGTIWPLGATFDYFAEIQSRGPRIFRKINQEWLGRLVFDPRRLAKRYIIGIPGFFVRVLWEKYFPSNTQKL